MIRRRVKEQRREITEEEEEEEEEEEKKRKEKEGFMDLKATAWDFAELERESEHNIYPVVGSSSGGHHQIQKSRGDCSVDLKLGRLGDFGEVSVNKWEDSRMSTMVSSPSATMKRARASSGNGVQTVSCLVDGCNADLSKCRDYHRRHKVCEVHSKTPKVIVGGQEQRFCQQCSRFHLLLEFDEVKRSCRKRLDGHNRRRRKPQPESLSMNSGSLFSYHQGTRLLPFAPQVFPSTTVASPTWRGVKNEEDTVNSHHLSLHYGNRQNPFPESFSRSHKGGKQFPFLQVNELGSRMVPQVSVCQPLIHNIASSENVGTGRKMFSNGFARVLDSDCALSLLSSPPSQHSGNSLSHVVQSDSNPMSQPLVPNLQYNNGLGRYQSQGMDGETMGSVLVSDATDAALNCQGIFHMGPNMSSQNGMPQTLPFSWD